MKTFLRKTLITLTALTTLFIVSGFILPEVAEARVGDPVPAASIEAEKQQNPSAPRKQDDPGFWGGILWGFAAGIAGLFLEFFGLLTGIAGGLLNGVIHYTVVNVSQNYNNLTPLSETWIVVRDIANIGFIFLLLYAAINTIIGRASDYQKIVVNVIVVALLINFSLFFTRVVIDASNILAITFYDASAPGALLGQQPESNALPGAINTIIGRVSDNQQAINTGLSNQFMRYLNLQNLWNVKETISYDIIISIGVFGSILLVVTAFVFFAMTMMFIVRYVVLMLVLILSPLAMVSYILPQAEDVRKKWMDALVGQAFFAPIFLFFTWISLRILDGVMLAFGAATDTNGNPVIIKEKLSGLVIGDQPLDLDAFELIINFIIVIVLMVSAMTISKDWANKAGNGMSSVTSWITGKAGNMSIGAVGWLGRNTVGRAGHALGESKKFKDWAVYGNKKQKAAANFALMSGRYLGNSSFDARGTSLGSTLGAGKAGGKKGFTGFIKKKSDDETNFAESLGPTEAEKAVAREKLKAAKEAYEDIKKKMPKDSPEVVAAKNSLDLAQSEVDRLEGVKNEDIEKMKKAEKNSDPAVVAAKEAEKEAEKNMRDREEEQKQADDAVKDAEKKMSEDPLLKQELALDAEINRKEEELKNTVINGSRKIKEEELAMKKLELEQVRKTAAEARKRIENDIETKRDDARKAREEFEKAKDAVQKTKLARENAEKAIDARYEKMKKDGTFASLGDKRKEAYAKSVENSPMAKFWGYNYEAAAKIREGKKPIDVIREFFDENKPKAGDAGSEGEKGGEKK